MHDTTTTEGSGPITTQRVLAATVFVAATVAGLAIGISPAEARIALNHNEVMLTSTGA
jgi:hypothetical protein